MQMGAFKMKCVSSFCWEWCSFFFCLTEKRIGKEGHSYLYHPEPKNWYEAKATCEAEGGKLAVPQNKESNQDVSNFMPGRGWIGVTDQFTEGLWQTPYNDKNLSYANWKKGEPNNDGKGEDCAEQRRDGVWNDLPCSLLRPFLCQYLEMEVEHLCRNCAIFSRYHDCVMLLSDLCQKCHITYKFWLFIWM